MCVFVSVNLRAKFLADRFDVNADVLKDFDPLYNVSAFSHPNLPVITNHFPDQVQLSKWGLIPFWVKDEETANKLSNNTVNARAETLGEKASFRVPFKNKRCIIPIDGFFEFQEINKKKYPYFIKLKDEQAFGLAGLFDTWENRVTGEIINSFSVITTTANPLMEKIHNRKKRMPVILEPGKEKLWLNNDIGADTLNKFLIPFDENKMTAFTVQKILTKRDGTNNVPESQKAFSYPEISGLF
ncbi:SOS response-associated peptidase [Bacteroidota bacterium]